MRSLHQFAFVGLGGALGSLTRLGLGEVATAPTVGTVIANIVGSLALGLLMHEPRPEQVSWFAATGFCGGLTTMSLFALEAVAGASVAPIGVVIGYVVISVGLGLVAFAGGRNVGPSQRLSTSPLSTVMTALVVIFVVLGLVSGLANSADYGGAFLFWFLGAAAVGAGLRGALSAKGSFNTQLIAILAINIVGAFLLGLTSPLFDVEVFPGFSNAGVLRSGANTSEIIFGTGALGAFTTFSTAIAQLERIDRETGRIKAVAVLLVMFALIIGAAALGRLIGPL